MIRPLKNKILKLVMMVVFPFVAINCVVATESPSTYQPAYREPAPGPTVTVSAVPYLIVLPGTYVYAAPELDMELYFFDGWWWRLDNNYWYRSQSYSGGWVYYADYPTFYYDVPTNWRVDYRQGQWSGQAWSYQRIQPQEAQTNWNDWRRTRRWENQNWGVQGRVPPPQTRPDHRRPPQGRPGQPPNPNQQPGYQPGHHPGPPAQQHQPQVNPGQPGHQPGPPVQQPPARKKIKKGSPNDPDQPEEDPKAKPKKPKKGHGNSD